MKTALTIAGSDSSGGAGIQADLKTMQACGVYGMSAITALTAQNTTGVKSIMAVSPDFLGDQLECVFSDIFPDAIKIGMVNDSGLINIIAEKIKKYQGKNVVVDPVMVATSGSKLMKDESVGDLAEKLFPLATVITPNIPEACVLAGMTIKSRKDMELAAEEIGKKNNCNVLLKGGHATNDANDVLWQDGKIVWFEGRKIDNPNTHGTGCTLSSAIASFLARGENLESAISKAKDYLTTALMDMLDLGKGSGPVNHSANLIIK